jgi:hypothetical protein
LEAERAVPTSLIRDVVSDAYRGISQSASLIPPRQRSEEKPRAPSGGTVPISQPPGIEHIDRLCDEADRRARAIAAQQQAETAWIEMLLERRNPHMAKTTYDPLKRYDDEAPSSHREKE